MRCSLAFGLVIMLAGLPVVSSAATKDSAPVITDSKVNQDKTNGSKPSLVGLGNLIGGLHQVGKYVSTVSKDAKIISHEEMAVAGQYRCLAQAVYFEARGEPQAGQQAIAHVVMNRLRDGRYPSTICGVVYQNQSLANRCQFSFACDGKSDRPNNKWAWRQSLKVAFEVLTGESKDATRSSTHFHATYVEPSWTSSLKQTVRVGQHIFYQEPRTRLARN